MKRIFVAIDFSEEVRRSANKHIESLKKNRRGLRIGWVKPEKMHLTLRFLGEVDDTVLSRVNEAVGELANATPRFRLAVSETGVFRNKKRPKVLWVGIDDSDSVLPDLKTKLDNRLEGIGFEKEKRKFRPHLTIARLRQAKGVGQTVDQHLNTVFEPIEFEVSEIAVMESRLEPNGAVYCKRSIGRFK